MEMKQGLNSLREAQEKGVWHQQRKFQKNLQRDLIAFRLSQKHESVARKSELEKLFAQRCRVVSEKTGPTQKKIIKQMVGRAGELPQEIRKHGEKVLMAKGVIKHMTIHEKYQNVFDKYTMDHEEYKQKLDDIQQGKLKKPITKLGSICEDLKSNRILLSPPPQKRKLIQIEQESMESWEDPVPTKETKESKMLSQSQIVRPNYQSVIL